MLKGPRLPRAPWTKKPLHTPYYRRQPQPEHSKRDRYDWVTLWTAILGVTVVAASTGFTAYQGYVAKRSLDIAVAQQRAWLKITLRDVSGFKLTKDGVSDDIRIEVTNVGPVPAFGVVGVVSMYGNAHFGGDDMFISLPKITQCGHAVVPKPYGITIFPGETVEVTPDTPAHMSRADLDDLRSGFSGQTRFAGFQIEACVEYLSSGSGVGHHTSETFAVQRKGEAPLSDGTFNLERDNVEPSGLQFSRSNAANEAN